MFIPDWDHPETTVPSLQEPGCDSRLRRVVTFVSPKIAQTVVVPPLNNRAIAFQRQAVEKATSDGGRVRQFAGGIALTIIAIWI
jgi:hypothetical protein